MIIVQPMHKSYSLFCYASDHGAGQQARHILFTLQSIFDFSCGVWQAFILDQCCIWSTSVSREALGASVVGNTYNKQNKQQDSCSDLSQMDEKMH